MINLPTDRDTDNLEKAPVHAIHANKSVPEFLAIIHQQETQLNELKAETVKTKLILTSLEQAVDKASLGFAIWDDQLDRDIFASEVMARIHGMMADAYVEEISSLDAYAQLVHPEDREAWLDNEKSIETDPDYSKSFYEYRVCLPDGKILHLREHSSLVPTADGVGPQYLVVMQDLTEIRRSED
ncbi:MAG: PAS domain-containing protein [Luminiphilus sp.]|nr:PAS domain-containing protein [Luminiphilus sp.]